MCVAAIIYAPVSMKYMKHMEDTNPHGAGVAWCVTDDNGAKAIKWVKGLKAEQIYAMQKKDEMIYPYIMHYRWATHGPKVPQLTHPFPTGPEAFFHDLVGTHHSVLMHNGVWNKYDKNLPTWVHPDIVKSASDSQVAAWICEYQEDILDDVDWATVLMRIAVDDDLAKEPELEIVTRGRWMQFEENWFSNLNWLPWSERPENKGKSWSATGHTVTPTKSESKADDEDEWWHYWNPCKVCTYYSCVCKDKEKTAPSCPTVPSPVVLAESLVEASTDYHVFNGKPVTAEEYKRLKQELDEKVFAHYTTGPSLLSENTQLNPDTPSEEEAIAESLILGNDEMTEQDMVEALLANRERQRGAPIEVTEEDIISEDAATVNAYLAREALIALNSKKKVAL